MQRDLLILRKAGRRRRLPVFIGIGALLIVNTLEVVLPLVLAAIIDCLIQTADASTVQRLAFLYIGIATVQACARFGWRVSLGYASAWIANDLRSDLFHAILRIPAVSLRRRQSGEFVSLANSDVENVAKLFGDGVVIVMDAVFMSIYITAILLWSDFVLGSIILIPALAMPFFLIRTDSNVARIHTEAQASLSKLTAIANESLSNARTIKIFNADAAFQERFRGYSLKYVVHARRLLGVEALYGPTLEALMSVSMVLLFLVGGWRTIEGALSLGMLVAFQRYLQQLAWPMRAVALSAITLRKARVSGERLARVIDEGAHTLVGKSTVESHSAAALEVQDLNIKDETSGALIVAGVSFCVDPGERIALVGDVGSGKSSILNALCDPDMDFTGRITLDGCPVGDLDPDSHQRRISYVPQEPFLFQLSVVDNLKLNDTPEQIDDAAIHAALHEAAIDDEVNGFAEGYDTVVGENGILLSGGQRQRLCIARAVLRKPGLLVLDNALAAVDAETELKILERLRDSKCSMLFATQRMSTLHLADRIIVLENGRVIDSGKLEDLLLKEESWFRRFYDAQQLEESYVLGGTIDDQR